ncbi:MAG: hypothetical protein JWR88_1290 [Pseudonocardia sp.]|nr:hypothetical protein [Pseudonocardia sp.]
MIVYGVHRQEWASVSETELLTANKAAAEAHAQRVSADYTYGVVVVTRRELDRAGCVWVVSVWKSGNRVTDHGTEGHWRKVQTSPV